MPRKVRQVFTNFSAGELNPLLNARTDAKAYFEGARQCKNWYLLDEGGVMRRPATQFTAELPAEARIIPFIFAEDEVVLPAVGELVIIPAVLNLKSAASEPVPHLISSVLVAA